MTVYKKGGIYRTGPGSAGPTKSGSGSAGAQMLHLGSIPLTCLWPRR